MTARRSKASWGRSDGDGDFGSRSSEDLEAATRLGPSWAVNEVTKVAGSCSCYQKS